MAVRTAYAPVAATVLTAANLAKLPGGWIGYNEVTADQGSITTSANLTSLTVSVTVGTGRRIKITGEGYFTATVNNAFVYLYIMEGATQLQERSITLPVTPATDYIHAEVVLTPTPGAHTYKLMAADPTTGVATLKAGATFPAFILVEDIGATP